jgi:hypothetical protein
VNGVFVCVCVCGTMFATKCAACLFLLEWVLQRAPTGFSRCDISFLPLLSLFLELWGSEITELTVLPPMSAAAGRIERLLNRIDIQQREQAAMRRLRKVAKELGSPKDDDLEQPFRVMLAEASKYGTATYATMQACRGAIMKRVIAKKGTTRGHWIEKQWVPLALKGFRRMEIRRVREEEEEAARVEKETVNQVVVKKARRRSMKPRTYRSQWPVRGHSRRSLSQVKNRLTSGI